MANANAAFGFRAVNRDGSPYSGGTLRAVIPASDGTATFIGDAVQLGGSSDTGYPTVVQGASGTAVFGVVVSFEADPDGLGNQYRLASTKRFCQVVTVDSTYFEVQSDDDTAALDGDAVGLNADFIVGAGDTVYGLSGMELDSNTALSTATLDLQIVSLVDRADNLLSGTGSTNKNAIVKFNVPQTAAGRTGV